MTNVYDKWGRCISTTNEVGNTTTMTYDDYGRMTSKTETLNASNWNGVGTAATRTWNWTYERVRNGVTYAANTHVNKEWRTQVEPAYDAAGDRRMTVREYDVNNRLATEQTGWVMQAARLLIAARWRDPFIHLRRRRQQGELHRSAQSYHHV